MTINALPNLRPLGIPELLDQAIRLYRRNFLKFVGIVAVVQVPITLFQMIYSLFAFGSVFDQLQAPTGPTADPFSMFGPDFLSATVGSSVLGFIGFILTQGLGTAALTIAIAEDYTHKAIGIFDAYRRIGRVWVRLILALLAAGLVGLGMFLFWIIVPCVGWFSGAGLLFFYASVVVPLIAPVVVLEHKSAFQAIRRAWELARRRFWWILGFALVVILFGQLIVTGPTILVTFLFQVLAGEPLFATDPTATFSLQTVIQTAVALVFSLIYLPLQLTCITLLYFNLRVSAEGFDLVLWSEQILNEALQPVDALAKVPTTGQRGLVTWTEIGYFVAVTFGALVIYATFVGLIVAIITGVVMAVAGGGGGGFSEF